MLQNFDNVTNFTQDNLLAFPSIPDDFNSIQNTVITIGDLHANAWLMIYFLLKYNVINVTPSQYENICTIYQDIAVLQNSDRELFNTELREKYQLFLELIDAIEVNNTPITIRFLGDELADRGECDLFILKILQKLHIHHVKFKILVSNHGVAFLSSLQYLIINKTEPYSEMMLKPYIMPSLVCLRKLLWHDFIHISELISLVQEVYFPYLDLLDYGISNNKEEIYIYTHAAMNQQQLEMLSTEFGIYWQDSSVSQLAYTLEKLKFKFKAEKLKALNDLFYQVAQSNDPQEKQLLTQEQLTKTVFWNHLIWGRSYSISRPFLLHEYRVCNVHGHDSSHVEPDPENPYYISLDSELGKNFSITRGENKVITRCEINQSQYQAKQKPEFWSIFKPYLPSRYQSILLCGVGFIFQQRWHLTIIMPFMQRFYERFLENHTKKLLKY